ncbi:MAG: hypothetical protein SFV17_04240 [Candidatus Obscuribacter sp.]|nr:hypothetical protein [Candidatus Obscuribacter sp.]
MVRNLEPAENEKQVAAATELLPSALVFAEAALNKPRPDLQNASIEADGSINFAAGVKSDAYSFAFERPGLNPAEARQLALAVLKEDGLKPVDALKASAGESRILGVGESHTYRYGKSAQIDYFKEHFEELADAGITDLMVELPQVLQPVFDRFNQERGKGDFTVPEKIVGTDGKVIDTPEAKGALAILRGYPPHYVELWKAARDAGIAVSPIDNNANALEPNYIEHWKGTAPPPTAAEIEAMNSPEHRQLSLRRDADMAANALAGLAVPHPSGRERKALLWLGSLHTADTAEADPASKRAGQILRESLGHTAVASFYGLTAGPESVDAGAYPLVGQLKEPRAASTGGAEPNHLGQVNLERPPDPKYAHLAIYGRKQSRLGDWDNLLVFP